MVKVRESDKQSALVELLQEHLSGVCLLEESSSLCLFVQGTVDLLNRLVELLNTLVVRLNGFLLGSVDIASSFLKLLVVLNALAVKLDHFLLESLVFLAGLSMLSCDV